MTLSNNENPANNAHSSHHDDLLHNAEQSVREGDPEAALRDVQELVRTHPTELRLRLFLFQLLAVLGRWQRAQSQLEVAATLDPSALGLARAYQAAIHCETVRSNVFAGEARPSTRGHMDPWLMLMIDAVRLEATGQAGAARQVRAQAYDMAPAVAGKHDGTPFAWIADADSRLGPVLEAIIEGEYCWLPFAHLQLVAIEAPHDLRDLVWMPAQFRFANGGETAGLIPARYPGSESSGDAMLALGRKTTWTEPAPDTYYGQGQRLFATDAGEVALLDVRSIVLDHSSAVTGAKPGAEPGVRSDSGPVSGSGPEQE
jgi:type VI secretion system protein ImpE